MVGPILRWPPPARGADSQVGDVGPKVAQRVAAERRRWWSSTPGKGRGRKLVAARTSASPSPATPASRAPSRVSNGHSGSTVSGVRPRVAGRSCSPVGHRRDSRRRRRRATFISTSISNPSRTYAFAAPSRAQRGRAPPSGRRLQTALAGHKNLTVVVDHDSGVLLLPHSEHDQKTLAKFFDRLGEARCAAITLVSADAASGSPTSRAPAARTRSCAWTRSTSWPSLIPAPASAGDQQASRGGDFT